MSSQIIDYSFFFSFNRKVFHKNNPIEENTFIGLLYIPNSRQAICFKMSRDELTYFFRMVFSTSSFASFFVQKNQS